MISPLVTDLYQLSMAQGYWLSGKLQDQAVFHLFFRKLPFKGGYALAGGINPIIDIIENFKFSSEDIEYLRSITTHNGTAQFCDGFLRYLSTLRLSLDVEAVPEGSVVFANEPLVRVRGSLFEAQLLESVLLNVVNFSTLIATKTSRIVYAAQSREVLELGLRRAQGIDGALTASRAAYIGGCHATSNVMAGKLFNIPVRGTHAHSWVMSFDSEIESFIAYADAMPNNCVFLVDTYDTLEGVRNAIIVGQRLRQRGFKMVGIRLDSGDLAWLSKEARKLLDVAGFQDALIIASNDLDEYLIESLIQQGAPIDVWGVGTKLVTAYDEPALGGVYKLAMIGHHGEPLMPRIKRSEMSIKTSNPGIQQVRRFSRDGQFVADVIFDEMYGCPTPCTMIDPFDPTRKRVLSQDLEHVDLLVPIIRNGRRVSSESSVHDIRSFAQSELNKLDPTVRRLVNPHTYSVGLSAELYAQRMDLIERSRLAVEGVKS